MSETRAATFDEVAIRTVRGYTGDPEQDIANAGLPVAAVLAEAHSDAHSSVSAVALVGGPDGAYRACHASFVNGLLIGIAWERERSR
jgi:hypothetical protein